MKITNYDEYVKECKESNVPENGIMAETEIIEEMMNDYAEIICEETCSCYLDGSRYKYLAIFAGRKTEEGEIHLSFLCLVTPEKDFEFLGYDEFVSMWKEEQLPEKQLPTLEQIIEELFLDQTFNPTEEKREQYFEVMISDEDERRFKIQVYFDYLPNEDNTKFIYRFKSFLYPDR